MSLRDVAGWFTEKWNVVVDGFHIAATQSFWDWPLWLSVPLAIGVPCLILAFIGNHSREMRGKPETIWGIIGFSVASILCALVTYDVWLGGRFFDDSDRALVFLRIGYPIMTIIFGWGALFGIASRRRKRETDADHRD